MGYSGSSHILPFILNAMWYNSFLLWNNYIMKKEGIVSMGIFASCKCIKMLQNPV